MPLELYLAYVAACAVIAVVPGPFVALIVGNSLRYGSRAGLLNIAGAQVGMVLLLGVLAIGLTSLIETLGLWFDWLRLAGAAYLAWLGWKLIRHPDSLGDPKSVTAPPSSGPWGGFVLQGFLVMVINPKMLVFYGAFIPQFLDPRGDYDRQLLLLGGTAMVVAMLSDGLYALMVGRAGRWLSRTRVRLVSRLSGACLIGGGVWLALTRTR